MKDMEGGRVCFEVGLENGKSQRDRKLEIMEGQVGI